MTKRLLIDATHPEETRVVIADENRIHEFDISATTKTQNKGNIYLAKVTRVEPSLQAAFVEYGGGRQGFLPFSEIHPDYYQIPVADRKRLLEEAEQEFEKAEAEEEQLRENPRPEREERGDRDRGVRRGRRRGRHRERGRRRDGETESLVAAEPKYDEQGNLIEPVAAENMAPLPVDAVISDAVDTDILDGTPEEEAALADIRDENREPEADHTPQEDQLVTEARTAIVSALTSSLTARSEVIAEADLEPLEESASSADTHADDEMTGHHHGEDGIDSPSHAAEPASEVETLGDEDDFTRRRKASFLRHYKIQEVIKRNQVILVQVVKEERGNKGASLSTYISLAGRYCVLMPNSPKTGGISRKISSSEDRKRLKEISEDIRTANGMSAIIRTAGIDRTRAEIKRDFDYLLKLWDQIRELTLSSTAPANVYEEADIIKRSLRDLYSSDIKDVVVAGEEAHKRAREFMKLMMPSHAARIKLHNEKTPIFYAYDVEEQLLRMHEPQVRLESGGSIVLNPTEALVAIDVNSGRSTTERNVEETALKTNLEAAQEVARQVRLRDLAGLIVIDFIDMFEFKNRRAVERQLKEALKNDRAKIQVGRISAFGLLEMSRQRMRPSLSETNTVSCPHCEGKGSVLSPDALGVQLLRFLEKEAANGNYAQLKLKVPATVALFLLNQKRARLLELEETYQVKVFVEVAEHIHNAAGFLLERITAEGQKTEVNGLDGIPSGGGGGGKRNRNRKRKRDRDYHDHDDRRSDDAEEATFEDTSEIQDEERGESHAEIIREQAEEDQGERGERDRGRRRRGGRRRGRDRDRGERGERFRAESAEGEPTYSSQADAISEAAPEAANGNEAPSSEAGEGRRRRSPRNRRPRQEQADDAQPSKFEQPVELVTADTVDVAQNSENGEKSSRRGWWRRMVE